MIYSSAVSAPVVPRSALHSLQPAGLGTSEVESLTSYFCRLANSQSCSTNDLAQFVINKVAPGRWNTYQSAEGKGRFVWFERSVSGLAEGALTWASALSELTGVTGLDRLTLLPMRSVLSPKALMAQNARWCPHCLEEDRVSGRQPYFRLSWDIALVKRCAKHQVPLVHQCPHCDKSNIRHTASFVVPGWCTSCDHFLGAPEQFGPYKRTPNDPEELQLQQASQVGELLALSSSTGFDVQLESMHQTIEALCDEFDGGVYAHFAKRLGVRKATVHYWKTSRTPLTLDTAMRIAIQSHVPLVNLLQGRLENWAPPGEYRQQGLFYPERSKHRQAREHDWEAIRLFLVKELKSPKVRSLAEIARDLDVDDRLLYVQATNEARMIGDRFVKYLHRLARQREAQLHVELNLAAHAIRRQDGAVTVSNLTEVLGRSKINSIRGLYTVLSSELGSQDECVE
jgi:transcriptional regulator with XRE-family HTH domain